MDVSLVGHHRYKLAYRDPSSSVNLSVWASGGRASLVTGLLCVTTWVVGMKGRNTDVIKPRCYGIRRKDI